MFFTNECYEEDLHSCNKILENLKNPIYKLYFNFLSYVLDIVNKLNLEFQSEKSKIHLVQKRVKELYKTLIRNYIKKEHIDKNPLKSINPSDPRFFIELNQIYFGAKVDLVDTKSLKENDVKNFKLRCLDFYIELCIEINKRFNFENPVMEYISIFDPNVAVSGEVGSIVKNTVTFFPHLVNNIEKLNSEWRLLADMESIKLYNLNSMEEFWGEVVRAKNELNNPVFPHLSMLVKGILSLPHSSAAAERVFSQLFLIKNKIRNRLDIGTCESILHTKALLNDDTCYTWVPPSDLLKKIQRVNNSLVG